MTRFAVLPCLALVSLSVFGAASSTTVTVNSVDANGIGKSIGTVHLEETEDGLTLHPDLKNLKPGKHGFHVHQNPSCEPGMKSGTKTAAAEAGEHLDPMMTMKHEGPMGDGHLGDLPVLTVDESGNATEPVTAPRLKLAAVRDRALMIHSGGDNNSDQPKPSGGGGEPMACGVIPLG